MSKTVTVGIGEAKIVTAQDQLVSYALGSCVGVCLYDQQKKIAGMVHILLPTQLMKNQNYNEYKFADSGILKLLEEMQEQGARRYHLSAKIAGGAEMFFVDSNKEGIGKRNVSAVLQTLHQLAIPVIAQDTGKDFGRSIWLTTEGQLTIKTVKHGTYVI